jgi:uncharacterized Zn-finger protein
MGPKSANLSVMHTSPSFSAAATEPAETIIVTARRIGCDGGAGTEKGALGHPLVYLTIGASGAVDCPYCGRHFVLDTAADHDDH